MTTVLTLQYIGESLGTWEFYSMQLLKCEQSRAPPLSQLSSIMAGLKPKSFFGDIIAQDLIVSMTRILWLGKEIACTAIWINIHICVISLKLTDVFQWLCLHAFLCHLVAHWPKDFLNIVWEFDFPENSTPPLPEDGRWWWLYHIDPQLSTDAWILSVVAWT